MFEKGDLIAGRYLVEGTLGSGGMAVVYRTVHQGTEGACAVKVPREEILKRPKAIEQFLREARVGRVIGKNPHIVDVIDAAVDARTGLPYMAMELLEGQPLNEVLEGETPVDSAQVLRIAVQLGDALGQAHRAGVVHRDLKPSNLFLVKDHRGQSQIKVLDFGIAKVLEGSEHMTGTMVGTMAYAAPEQQGSDLRVIAEGKGVNVARSVSPRTDVWALGLLFWEMLTGLVPERYWGADSVAGLVFKLVEGMERRPVPSERAGERAGLLPAGFDAWCLRCLEVEAGRRWRDGG
jgi:serine/threonine-protein kinase